MPVSIDHPNVVVKVRDVTLVDTSGQVKARRDESTQEGDAVRFQCLNHIPVLGIRNRFRAENCQSLDVVWVATVDQALDAVGQAWADGEGRDAEIPTTLAGRPEEWLEAD